LAGAWKAKTDSRVSGEGANVCRSAPVLAAACRSQRRPPAGPGVSAGMRFDAKRRLVESVWCRPGLIACR
jgi:hypothetical protein